MSKRETAPLNPGWIKSIVSDNYNDDELHKIVVFYVIHTPCEHISYSSKTMKSYGWSKDVWKKGLLKKELFKVAGFEKNRNFFSVKKAENIKEMFKKSNLSSNFYRSRDNEKIAIFVPNGYNDFTAVLYHIRNSLAHGRFTIYPAEKPDNPNEIFFVMEDGVKKGDEFFVRARMIIKRQTLLDWIDIISTKSKEIQEKSKK